MLDLKKTVTLMLFIMLCLSVFALPEYRITQDPTSQSVTLEMRLYKVTVDNYGRIQDYLIVNTQTKSMVSVYKYTNDSYDLLDSDGKEILPVSFDIKESEDKSKVEFIYGFENGGTKEYIFHNNPNFEFDLLLKGLSGMVVLPNISLPGKVSSFSVENLSSYGISSATNSYVSYKAKPFKISLIVSSDAPIDKKSLTVSFSGKLNLKNFMGPMKLTLIRELYQGEDYKTVNGLLKDVKAIGWTTVIFYWFVEFLWWLNNVTGNFGWAIIIFTLIINVIFLPLYMKQKKSMIRMKELQPELDKLKKKYPNNPQKMQEAQMALYKEKGFNPASGCLLALIQLPIFIVLWQVIQYFGESFAYNPRFLIWQDLSVGGWAENWLFIVVSLLAYIVNAMLSSQDVKAAWQTILMSLLFPFMLIGLPSGVFIYYTLNAILQVCITLLVNFLYKSKGIGFRDLFGLGPKPVRR